MTVFGILYKKNGETVPLNKVWNDNRDAQRVAKSLKEALMTNDVEIFSAQVRSAVSDETIAAIKDEVLLKK